MHPGALRERHSKVSDEALAKPLVFLSVAGAWTQ